MNSKIIKIKIENNFIQKYFHNLFGIGRHLGKNLVTTPIKILEIGCGGGLTTEIIREHYPGAQIDAIDYDDRLIDYAKNHRHSLNVNFYKADATKLEYPNDTFDEVFSSRVLHHIKNYDVALSEVYRVMKHGGILHIVDIPSREFNFTHISKSNLEALFTKEEISNLLMKIGFNIEKSTGEMLFYIKCLKQ